MSTYYKVLCKGHRACHGGTYRYTPNRWTKRLTTKLCVSGYHICTLEQLTRWLYADSDDLLPLELWEVEAEGVTDTTDKAVAERIRLTRLVGTLDECDLRWLGTIFAESALRNTNDPRVGECINAVRAYSLGFLDDDGLRSAARSAWSAAELAAESAAWSAAELAAHSAAWSAWSAWSAAHSAAHSAAESAARSAQGQAVLDYLRGGAR